ncbi:MAG: ATP-dependent Clp protease adaptor ClpS [Dehalococcoidia bacterium]|nr:ATP-dependent Clp protease adaptor ClpS [Dehalococcoidia bacterium]
MPATANLPALPPAATREPVVTPTRTPARTRGEETQQEPEHLWRLVLLDDNDHTYEYVIEMLGTIFGYAPEKAFALARLVDTHGRVTLMTAERRECEAKQSQIHAYGADPRIPTSRGSMSAIVEEAT